MIKENLSWRKDDSKGLDFFPFVFAWQRLDHSWDGTGIISISIPNSNHLII